jgi:hypothetical protein
MKTLVRCLAGSLALTLSICAPGLEAQVNAPLTAATISNPSLIVSQIRGVKNYASVLTQRMSYDRLKAMNVDRQQHIVSDTNKLVGLATDLHLQVQGEREITANELSRRAAEIERLAREVQDKMKNN